MRIFFVFCILMAFACKNKPVDYSGNTPLTVKEFAAAFPLVNGNWQMSDMELSSTNDSLVLGYPLLKQFFPDSAFQPLQPAKCQFFPVGKIVKEKEHYYLLAARSGKTLHLFVVVTSDKNQFLGSKLLLDNRSKDQYQRMVSINKEPTFLLSQEKKGLREETLFTRTGWVYNNAGFFMVVIKDSNEDPIKSKVINPLDTLPRLQKFSGDYGKKPQRLLSIRDGKDANHYLFFLSLNNKEKGCEGELKGEFVLTGPGKGQYQINGDGCQVVFQLSKSVVQVTERGSCGNHRGMKCSFNDSYPRQRAN